MPPMEECFRIEECLRILDGIWEREYLINNGPLVRRLEKELKTSLDVCHVSFVSNGTIALQIAIKALGLKGEVITTPFSYVAITSSLVREGCKPVFVDIDPLTLNMDPASIEEAITAEPTGILARHVFGNPCDIDAIQAIVDENGLKVIYDVAHCFGTTTYKGRSVFDYGDDISTISFHATKLFHTVEGGAVFTKVDAWHKRIQYRRNFGHAVPEKFNGVGINGKNSELHASMGLVNLNHVERILKSRKEQCQLYNELLEDFSVRTIEVQPGSEWNHSYYPAIFEDEATALRVKTTLEKEKIYSRRYFYPGLETRDYVTAADVRISKDISKRILCMPLYYELNMKDVERICITIGEI